MATKKRIFGWLSISLFALLVFVWLFGMRIMRFYQSRHTASQAPIVATVPVNLQNLTVAQDRGVTVSFRGVEFEVPWSDVDRTKSKSIGHDAVMPFGSSKVILEFVGGPNEDLQGLARSETTRFVPAAVSIAYGPSAVSSDYNFMNAVLKTSPRDVSLFSRGGRMGALNVIVIAKAIMPPTTDWAIYIVRSQEFRGLQMGDPVRRPAKMCVRLYGSDAEVEIYFSQKPGPATTPAITQEDLNRITQSLRTSAHTQHTLQITDD
ncbi:MAG: hypothetical protein WA209_05090 [Candidatus Acidiferrales bacterium]